MTNLYSSKIRAIHVIGFTTAILLVIFAFRWQVVDASRLQEELQLRRKAYLIPSVRGPILSRDSSTLAYSEPRADLYAYTVEMDVAEQQGQQTREEFYRKILPYTKFTTIAELEQLFIDKKKEKIVWFQIAKGLTLKQRDEVDALKRDKDKGKLQGLDLPYAQQRFYPENTLAGQLIGFADNRDDGSMIGRSGIEAWGNGDLEPQKGYVTYDIDAAGNPVTGTTDAKIQAKRGSTIVTTIDKFLQKKLEENLVQGVARFQAKAAQGIIMDPKSGEVLALANVPLFNPNERAVLDPAIYSNAAITQPYEIGSVGKAFTLTAAIDANVYKPGDIVIDGHNGCENLIEGFRVCNLFNRKAGALTLERATVLSDNVAYYHISKTIGAETLHQYLNDFGVGYKSGIQLLEESHGVIKDANRWNENDISAYSYGTSYGMNTVGAAAGVAAIANYGVRMQPMLVKEITGADGRKVEYKPRAIKKVMAESSSQVVSEILFQVFKSNLSEAYYKAALKDVRIGMKSGTGLIAKDGVYTKDYNATYVGFDISPDRRFLMLIRLDSPQIGRISGENARVLWLDTFLSMKDYLGM